MESEKEFETRNGREMGNETEFDMGNGQKWETIQYKKHHFPKKTEKNKRIQAQFDIIGIDFNKKQEKIEEIQKRERRDTT